jgi:regulation of enolase protein 1 (concanavalin A-like superfamily)
MPDGVVIPGLSHTFEWLVAPVAWEALGAHAPGITVGPRTDLFVAPDGSGAQRAAAMLVTQVEDDFLFSARVGAQHGALFDAAVLLLWADEQTWVKLCLEQAPSGHPMVVSVVTRGLSDDANAFEVDGHEAWLRICRMGGAFALHTSSDGATWQLVRHFALSVGESVGVGFLAQSPTGPGLRATFRDIQLSPGALADIRDGSQEGSPRLDGCGNAKGGAPC